MRKIVRESKFRNVYGQSYQKEKQFDGVVTSASRLDGNLVAINRLFIAAVLPTSGGGVFTVLRRDKPGRYDTFVKYEGHAAEILDLSWSPFDPYKIASGSDDGLVLVRWVEQDETKADDKSSVVTLKQSSRRVVQTQWHPSALDILFVVNLDSINIFDVETQDCIRCIDTSRINDTIFSFCLNYEGSLAAAGFKDKKVRIFDMMTGEMKTEFLTHEGTKAIKVAWLLGMYGDDLLITSGSTKMSARQLSVWKISDPSQPLLIEAVDQGSAVFNLYYDRDTKLILSYAKGESSVRFYEFDIDPEPKLHLLTTYSAPDSHRSLAFGSKLCCDFGANEIIHSVRVLNKGLEELMFIVPRKFEGFQDDLYPDTPGEEPAMSAEEFIGGKIASPLVVSVKTLHSVTSPLSSVTSVTRSTTFSRRANVERGPSSVSRSEHEAPFDNNLIQEVQEIRSILETMNKRIDILEKKDQD
ncbi:hypothetical protein MXB_1290 [Myxobolus squamalis]|nr:hypothetical protein MXB_1290 [Myxobolus squamalis]